MNKKNILNWGTVILASVLAFETSWYFTFNAKPVSNQAPVAKEPEEPIKEPTDSEIAWAYRDYITSRITLEPSSYLMPIPKELTFEECLERNDMDEKSKEVLKHVMKKLTGNETTDPIYKRFYFEDLLDNLERTNPNDRVFRVLERQNAQVDWVR